MTNDDKQRYRETIGKLATIMTYAMLANIFFVAMEFFTAFYSAIPEHASHFKFLYVGLEGHRELVPWMWLSAALILGATVVLVNPRWRGREGLLTLACAAVVLSIWIEKGLGFVVPGFIPSTLGDFVQYLPSLNEMMLCIGIWAFGLLIYTLFLKGAIPIVNQQNLH